MLRVTVWSKKDPKIMETFVVKTEVSMENLMAVLKEETPYQVSVMEGPLEAPTFYTVFEALDHVHHICLYKKEEIDDSKEFDIRPEQAAQAILRGCDSATLNEDGKYHVIFKRTRVNRINLDE